MALDIQMLQEEVGLEEAQLGNGLHLLGIQVQQDLVGVKQQLNMAILEMMMKTQSKPQNQLVHRLKTLLTDIVTIQRILNFAIMMEETVATRMLSICIARNALAIQMHPRVQMRNQMSLWNKMITAQ